MRCFWPSRSAQRSSAAAAPVGATISGTTDRVATFAGTYDNEGVLNLAGSLSGEYTIALAQASPDATIVRVEPIITNVPAELVEISARELVIPAGSTTVAVSVRMIEENYDFMENVFGPVTYELGVRVVEARGSQVTVVDGEAKMVIEKAAYVAVASLVGVEGNAVTFKRNFIDGAIVNEDPITYDVKVVVDRPVLEDTKFVVRICRRRALYARCRGDDSGRGERVGRNDVVGDGRLPRSGRRTRHFPGAAHGRAGRRYRRGRRRSGGCRRCDFDREEVRSPDFPVRGRSVVEEVSDERMDRANQRQLKFEC